LQQIKDLAARRQLSLRKEKIFGRIFRKTVQLETEKRTVVSSSGLRKVRDWASRRIGLLRNEKIDVTVTALRKEDIAVHL
jgi:hypothetical protein